MPELAQLTELAAAFHHERAIEFFLALTGQKERLEAAAIAGRYPQLFARETLDYIAGLGDADASPRLRQALLRQFSDYYVQDALREAGERLTNSEGAATVAWGHERIPYRSVAARLSSEPDSGARATLCAAWLRELERLNAQRIELKELEAQTLAGLGYHDAADYAHRLHGLDLHPLRDRLQLFLDMTREAYMERLYHYVVEEAGVGPQLYYSDLGWVLAGRSYDYLFDPRDMLPALQRTVRGLGIDLDRLPGVTLDLEPRPRKTPRAFCTSPDAPRDVRLVLTPRGGQDDYATLFHEAGHLLFSAHMDPALPFVYRHHGDTSVHESYAFLLQHLTESPAWWYEVMGVKQLDSAVVTMPGAPTLRQCLAFMRFDRFYMLRRYSAKLTYEIEFYKRGGIASDRNTLRGRYSRLLEDELRFPYPAERYLDDFDRGFYVAQYLQAWIWEVQLRRHLEHEFGEAWFTQKRAGDFLRELWSVGMTYDITETAQRLGYGAGLDVDLIQYELLEGWTSPARLERSP
jgi:hypothetical protein